MKKVVKFALGAVCVVGFASCNNLSSNQESNPANDSIAMARGCVMGAQLEQQLMYSEMQGEKIDREEFLKGFKEGLSSADNAKVFGYYAGQITGYQMAKKQVEDKVSLDLFFKYFEAALKKDTTLTAWTPEQAMAFLQKEEPKMYEKKMEAEFGANKVAGKEFIEKFKKEEGVITTESGIAYKVLQEGKGATPTAEDKVEVKYTGTLVDGKEFDTSGDKTVEFGVNQVIKGWTEMLQLMKEGEKVKVVIPQELAYGNREMGNIKPFSTLVFEVELVKVVK